MAVGRHSGGVICADLGGVLRCLLTLACAGVFLCVTYGAPSQAARVLRFEDLRGWDKDDHTAALEVFRTTCTKLDAATWARLCEMAQGDIPAKAFFEMFFRPVVYEGSEEVLFTGYFEPVLRGSRVQTGPFRVPVYRRPKSLKMGSDRATRRAIVVDRVLSGQGLEIAYVDNAVDLFFAQIQGSATVQLTNGQRIRIGFGGHNGHAYRSMGQWLINRGYIEPHQASARFLRNWAKKNPRVARQAMLASDGYVFFEEIRVDRDEGPRGALLENLTTKRSIAVDPKEYPLGGVFWVEKRGKAPMEQLFVAQDVGSRIKTRGRVDIFYGTGEAAGKEAGQTRDTGRLYTLLPIDLAYTVMREAQVK